MDQRPSPHTYFDKTMVFKMIISEELGTDCSELYQFHFITLNKWPLEEDSPILVKDHRAQPWS
jgi:hypothetical protein